MRRDPSERHNIADSQPAIVASMSKQLSTYQPYVTCHMTALELAPYTCNSSGGEAWSPGAGYPTQYAGPCCFRK